MPNQLFTAGCVWFRVAAPNRSSVHTVFTRRRQRTARIDRDGRVGVSAAPWQRRHREAEEPVTDSASSRSSKASLAKSAFLVRCQPRFRRG
jgi:hypothetical protein